MNGLDAEKYGILNNLKSDKTYVFEGEYFLGGK